MTNDSFYAKTAIDSHEFNIIEKMTVRRRYVIINLFCAICSNKLKPQGIIFF